MGNQTQAKYKLRVTPCMCTGRYQIEVCDVGNNNGGWKRFGGFTYMDEGMAQIVIWMITAKYPQYREE